MQGRFHPDSRDLYAVGILRVLYAVGMLRRLDSRRSLTGGAVCRGIHKIGFQGVSYLDKRHILRYDL